jgi:hypothetical protein
MYSLLQSGHLSLYTPDEAYLLMGTNSTRNM